MSKQTRTPWFPVSTPPSKVGEYEVLYVGEAGTISRRFWNGAYWMNFERTAHSFFSLASSDQWRGLAKKP